MALQCNDTPYFHKILANTWTALVRAGQQQSVVRVFAILDFHSSRHSGERHIENMKKIKEMIPIRMCTNEQWTCGVNSKSSFSSKRNALPTCVVCTGFMLPMINATLALISANVVSYPWHLSSTNTFRWHVESCISCHPSNSTYKECQLGDNESLLGVQIMRMIMIRMVVATC